METSLQKTIMNIIAIANSNTEHIPPIMTSETNPFPYRIVLNPKMGNGGWEVQVHTRVSFEPALGGVRMIPNDFNIENFWESKTA